MTILTATLLKFIKENPDWYRQAETAMENISGSVSSLQDISVTDIVEGLNNISVAQVTAGLTGSAFLNSLGVAVRAKLIADDNEIRNSIIDFIMTAIFERLAVAVTNNLTNEMMLAINTKIINLATDVLGDNFAP